MIATLMLDLDDAPDFPGSSGTALGRPLAAYPYIAVRAAGGIPRHFVVTGTQAVKAVALQNGAVIIDPPETDGAKTPMQLFLERGYRFVVDELKSDDETLELLVLFFSNAPMIAEGLLGRGLDALQARPELDGAATVSPAPRHNPFAARRERDGLAEPYVKAKAELKAEPLYPDYGFQILRPKAIEEAVGAQPFPWLGKNVLALKQNAGGPVDYQWQLGGAESWLRRHGHSDLSASLELQPKPQPQPKTDRR